MGVGESLGLKPNTFAAILPSMCLRRSTTPEENQAQPARYNYTTTPTNDEHSGISTMDVRYRYTRKKHATNAPQVDTNVNMQGCARTNAL